MRLLIALLFIIVFSNAKEVEYISLGAYDSHIEATKALDKVDHSRFIQELSKRYSFKITISKMKGNFNIVLTSFDNPSDIKILYELLKRDYLSIKTNYRVVEKKESSDIIWFVVVFVMFMIIGGMVFARSSQKYQSLQEQYDRLKKLKDTLSSKHEEILNNLGYKIENSAKTMISERDKIINEPLREYSKEVVEKKFKSIQKTDKILTDTTDQIIDFLKAKSGKLHLENKRVDINRVLESITSFITQNYQGKSVELIYDVNVDVPRYILGDLSRISELLINILDFSYRVTSRGYIKLVISKFDHVAANPVLEFKIVDNSAGVKKEQQNALFTPFNNKETPGGLFISKELARLMGGRLEFISRYGKGNTFSITIPLKVDEETSQFYLLASDQLSSDELENKYIGVIDKDEDVANAIKKSFLHFVKNVSSVAHYSLSDYDVINRYDLLLIEHSMITASILEILKKIQQERDFRVIAMHSMLNTDYKEIMDNAIDRYISKPLSPSHALKIFLDTYSSLKVVGSEDEVIFMENMEDNFHSRLPKQYPNPIPDTKDATKEFFKDFFGSAVLMITDDAMVEKILGELIAQSGIRCALAKNSEGAVDQLNKYYNNFHLILINMNGDNNKCYVLAKMIRANRNYDKIPIIAIVDNQYDQNEILKVGINGYLIKPIRVAGIYTAFSYFLPKVDLGAPLIRLTQSEHVLDITRGIMQTKHDYRLYLELVQEFRDAYGESGERFKKLIEEQDYTTLKEFINNMKGLSDILAANKMYALLENLELTLQAKRYNELPQYIEQYCEELENLNTNIEIYTRSVEKEQQDI